MSDVDQRIVEMRFDNKQFEAGVQESVKSLNQLKNGLKLEESARNLSGLQRVANTFSLSNIANGVETVASRFSALGIVGTTILQNITNSALNAGKRIIKALTLDPVEMGFREYETQINAVQTILANTSSKGTTLEQVNSALDELNTYADKTIYNFTEMTRNIGTFTAAGVDLETSTKAIKGIANLAAVSGSNSQQASTAMYQLSQAMAAGTVKLMDWNSVVNAGMGGQVFQDALKDTARVHGIAIDQMIKEEGSFRETLQKGWLTTEVLTETLSKFTGDLNEEQLKTMGYTSEQIQSILKMGQTANDAATKVKTFTQLWDTLKEAAQSGWAQSWEIIIGDFEEAKILLTDVSNVLGAMIGASSEARNEMLQGWKDLGGRATLIESVRNGFEGVLSVINPLKEAFYDIFPPVTAEQLNNITLGLENLTEKLKLGEIPAENLKRTFKGVFAVLSIGKEAFTALFTAIGKSIEYLLPAAGGLLQFTGGIGDWLVGVEQAIKAGDIFNKTFEKIGQIVRPIADIIRDAFIGITTAIADFATLNLDGLDELSERVAARFAPFGFLGAIVEKGVSAVIGALKKLAPIFASIGSNVGDSMQKITSSLGEFNFSKVMDLFNSGVFAAILIGVKKFIDTLGSLTENSGGILSSLKTILDGVKGSLEAWQSSIKAKTLMTIAGAIAILAASLVVLSLIDSDKLTNALVAISVLFAELFMSMSAFEKIAGGSGFFAMSKIAGMMVVLSTSVLILSAAVSNLANLSWEELIRGLAGVAGLSATLVVAAKSLSTSSGKLIRGSAGLLVFAAAIRVLVGAVEDLGALDTASLTKGLIGVGVLCAELVLFLKTSNLESLSISRGLGLIALGFAIQILSNAVATFGSLNTEELLRGLIGLGVVLAEIAVFAKATGDSKRLITTATGLVILGAAINIFAIAIEKIGSMSLAEIGKGLLGMAGALVAVTGALIFMPPNMIGIGLGLLGVSTALVLLARALQEMGKMSLAEVGKSLLALAGAMTILAIGLNAMVGALPGAAAMLVVSAALALFVPALRSLGEMSLGEMGMALLSLASVFAVLGVSSIVLAPLIPTMLGLAAAVSLFGVSILAIGAGVMLFSAGLSALAVSGAAGAAALVLVVSSIVGLVPMLIQQIGVGIVALAGVITEGAPAILEALTAVLVSLSLAIIAASPQIAEAILVLVNALLKVLDEAIPQIIDTGINLILALLRGIRDNIGEIIDVAVDTVLAFIDGIASQIPKLIDAGYDLIIDFIDGLAESIEENMPRLLKSIAKLGTSIISGLVDGIMGGIEEVGSSLIEIGSTAIDSLASFLGINSPSKVFESLGKYTSDGFVLGIRDQFSNVKKTSNDLGSTVLNGVKTYLKIASPSKVMRDEVGRYIVQGIAEGITADMSAEEAATKKAQNIVNAFKAELDKFSLDATTADLEYQLWQNVSGAGATPSAQAAAQLAVLSQKLNIQSEKVQLAQAEYQTTLDSFGKQSESTQEAYNKYLQEQIDLADLSAQLSQAQTTKMETQKASQNAYYAYLRENAESLSGFGFTMEQIQAAAAESSGYDPALMTESMQLDVKEAVSSAMGTVQTVYSETAKATLGSLTKNFDTWGNSYAEALGTGIQKGTPSASSKTKAMGDSCVTTVKNMKQEWSQAGVDMVGGFIEGISSQIEAAAKAAAAMAAAALAAAKATFQINSPSRAFAELGMYADLGLAKGLLDYANVASNAASMVGEDTISTISSAIAKLSNSVSDDAQLQPVITPVIDLSAFNKEKKSMGESMRSTFIPMATIAQASNIQRRMTVGSVLGQPQQGTSETQNISFVQNNYSPRALSRLDVYRQTKNQIAMLKGVAGTT